MCTLRRRLSAARLLNAAFVWPQEARAGASLCGEEPLLRARVSAGLAGPGGVQGRLPFAHLCCSPGLRQALLAYQLQAWKAICPVGGCCLCSQSWLCTISAGSLPPPLALLSSDPLCPSSLSSPLPLSLASSSLCLRQEDPAGAGQPGAPRELRGFRLAKARVCVCVCVSAWTDS